MSGVNRIILGVVGLALLVGGVLVLLINTNLLDAVLLQLGSVRRQPRSTDPMLPVGLTAAVAPSLMAVIGAAALLLAAFAVWWLAAQFRRPAQTPDFRLQSDVSRGSTVVTPTALGAAISSQLERLPGVVQATAVVRGAVQAPHLAVRVTVDDRSDVADVVATIVSEVGGGLAVALGSTVDSLKVLVGVDRSGGTDSTAVVPPSPASRAPADR